MSDDDSESSVNLKDGILQRMYDYTFGTVFGIIGSLTINGLFAGLPTVFSGIVWVLKIIFMALYYILFKIVPFLIQYVGIPMFILGAILGIMFLGGHMLFVVLFIVGMYFYIRGLFNVKLVSKAPKSNSNTLAAPPKENNNEFKVK
jgi:hypothetical protein